MVRSDCRVAHRRRFIVQHVDVRGQALVLPEAFRGRQVTVRVDRRVGHLLGVSVPRPRLDAHAVSQVEFLHFAFSFEPWSIVVRDLPHLVV